MTPQEKEIKINSNQTFTQKIKKHFWIIFFVFVSIFLYICYIKEDPKTGMQVISQHQEKVIISKKKADLTPGQISSLRSSIRLLQSSGFKVIEKQYDNSYMPEHSYIMCPENIYNAIKIVRSFGYDVVHINDINYDRSKDFFMRIMKNE